MSDQTPRVAVITSASQGIGASLVPASRKLGHGALSTSPTIGSSDDPMIARVQGDIATADNAERVTREAIGRFGHIDTLINRAGVLVAKRPPAFLGRSGERDALDRLLETARGGQSAVLLIRGEAGIGKTALLSYAARQAGGFRVAQIAGVEAEMELPFAGLHQLCAPLLGKVDVLPAPQQRALRVALGLTSGEAPDRFLVALGALSLLAEVAEKQPLLCLVDDAQWLDGASRQVLGFVARRLLAESVVIVFGVREPTQDGELADLPELVLEGLGEEDSRSLLATVIPGRIDERVRDRIVAETRGNPLALLELPRGLSPAQLAGGFGLPEPLPLSGRIEESFLRRQAGAVVAASMNRRRSNRGLAAASSSAKHCARCRITRASSGASTASAARCARQSTRATSRSTASTAISPLPSARRSWSTMTGTCVQVMDMCDSSLVG